MPLGGALVGSPRGYVPPRPAPRLTRRSSCQLDLPPLVGSELELGCFSSVDIIFLFMAVFRVVLFFGGRKKSLSQLAGVR